MLPPSDFRLKRPVPPLLEEETCDDSLDELLARWNQRRPIGSVAPFYDDEYEEMRYYEILRGEE
jgi:hypothetical protein